MAFDLLYGKFVVGFIGGLLYGGLAVGGRYSFKREVSGQLSARPRQIAAASASWPVLLPKELLKERMVHGDDSVPGPVSDQLSCTTRRFVEFINSVLPDAKINFVSEELANEGFTPSVFSLDLPSIGNSIKEKETYKRELNLKLINLMIEKISEESKFCVSYGQLKGCYWTIPATSTQGTTKEENKDYIVRVALSPKMDIKRHEEIFVEFIKSI